VVVWAIGGMLIAAEVISRRRRKERRAYSGNGALRASDIFGVIPYPCVELCEFLAVRPGKCAYVRHSELQMNGRC
jgi:hypothetical protein